MRKQSYPNQPTDDVLATIKDLVAKKRNGDFEAANHGYSILAEQEQNDLHNYPYVLKSWAKVLVCIGNYDIAEEKMSLAAKLFDSRNNSSEAWQCNDQVQTIENRTRNWADFCEYVLGVSGGMVDLSNS